VYGENVIVKEESKVHILQINNIVAHVDGYWMRHYATDFLAAAKAFVAPKNRFSPVPYYLICHSIELSLKSFLFSAGFKRKDRKKLNHNLEEALKAAEDKGLGTHIEITPLDRDALNKINKLYPKKEFEYFESLETIYDPHDFDLEVIASFAQRLLDAIESPVRASIIEQ
jgi:hypothetical protein